MKVNLTRYYSSIILRLILEKAFRISEKVGSNHWKLLSLKAKSLIPSDLLIWKNKIYVINISSSRDIWSFMLVISQGAKSQIAR